MDKAEFFAQVRKLPSGCWEWTGRTTATGYGQVWTGSAFTGAHRYALWLMNGEPVPDHLFVCHHCDNPPCVNPEHLFVGTALDNNRDMIRKGRQRLVGRPRENRRFCPQGHPLSGDNLYEWGNGYRKCRKCIAAASRRRHRRMKEAA